MLRVFGELKCNVVHHETFFLMCQIKINFFFFL